MAEDSCLKNHQIISIVDDDDSLRHAMSSLLRSLGWGVRLYSSAQAFLQSGRLDDITGLVSHIDMPGMTGLEMQQRLLTDGHALPIIFVTAYATEAVRRQALKNGAVCFLSKPVDESVISRCLQALQREKPEPVGESGK